MKALLMLSLVLISGVTLAATEVVECVTKNGQTRATVTREDYKKLTIRNLQVDIKHGDEPVRTFKGLSKDTNNLLLNAAGSFLAVNEEVKKVIGGGVEGIIINIDKAKASLAFDGSVYLLDCSAQKIEE